MKKELIYKTYNTTFNTLDKWLIPFWFFYIRYWLADVFFRSGLVSISDWENNINLFKYEFNVPLLSPELAAFLSTAASDFAFASSETTAGFTSVCALAWTQMQNTIAKRVMSFLFIIFFVLSWCTTI